MTDSLYTRATSTNAPLTDEKKELTKKRIRSLLLSIATEIQNSRPEDGKPSIGLRHIDFTQLAEILCGKSIIETSEQIEYIIEIFTSMIEEFKKRCVTKAEPGHECLRMLALAEIYYAIDYLKTNRLYIWIQKESKILELLKSTLRDRNLRISRDYRNWFMYCQKGWGDEKDPHTHRHCYRDRWGCHGFRQRRPPKKRPHGSCSGEPARKRSCI